MLRGAPVYECLWRPSLLFGGDRMAVLGSFCLFILWNYIALCYRFLGVVSVFSGLVFLCGGLWALKRVAKYDPLFFPKVKRYLSFQKTYRAHGNLLRKNFRGMGW